MRVEYTRRALADIRRIAADSLAFGPEVAAALEARLRTTIARIAAHPAWVARVADRPGVRVASLVRYPFRIFYRVLADRVRILHIRHTSRRTWSADA
jgi:plasmid stabilization system protein ParE